MICGAFFGDNLSFISDTTIAVCNGQGCRMKDKFYANLKIVAYAVIITLAILFYVSSKYKISNEMKYYWNLVNIIPYIIVLALSMAE